MKRSIQQTVLAMLIVAAAGSHARAEPGDVRWRFEIPTSLSGAFVGIGPDGRVYATDSFNLYALSASGALLWAHPGGGGGRPISFGDDGTIYTSSSSIGVRAINPDGSLRWEYMPPTPNKLHAGPNFAPNGNIYAAQEIRAGNGIGAFALDTNGGLLWSDAGAPEIGPADLSNSNIVFASGRLFAGMEFLRGSFPASYAFTLDGDQRWYSGAGGLNIPATSFPELMLDGRLAYRYGQVGIMAVRQDGEVDWQLIHPGGASILTEPAVGSNGIIYTGDWSGIKLWAVNANGTTRWARPPESGLLLDRVGVSPDSSVIVATGGQFGSSGWVRGYDTVDGGMLWHLQLQPEDGLSQNGWSFRPGFSADSRTAYITTRFASSGVGHSYLYAIALVDDLACAADADGNGTVEVPDIFAFLSAWFANDAAADFDGDSVIAVPDIFAFLGAWFAGC